MVQPRPALGYAMVAIAATLFAVNGTVSKVILGSGISSGQLTAVRCAGALIGLALIAAATRPRSLRIRHRRAAAADRARHRPRRRAVGLLLRDPPARHRDRAADPVRRADPRRALGALRLPRTRPPAHLGRARPLARRPHAHRRDLARRPPQRSRRGRVRLGGNQLRGVRPDRRARRPRVAIPISLSAWGFLFATIFWSLLAPWWNFPGSRVDDHVSLLGNLASTHLPLWLLMLWMVVLGGIVPFALIVSALRHISATRAGITAMLEPVVAIIVAWAWLGESLRAGPAVRGGPYPPRDRAGPDGPLKKPL